MQLGRLPSELAQQMTAAEELAFMAFYRDDPFGDHRADIRSAQIVKMLYDVNAGKRAEKRKLTDFLPFYKKRGTVDEDVSDKLKKRFSMMMETKD